MVRSISVFTVLLSANISLSAQWLKYPTPPDSANTRWENEKDVQHMNAGAQKAGGEAK
jgi:hypothetical protein